VTSLLLALAASGAWGISDFLGGLRTRTLALPVVLAGSQFAGLAVLLGLVSRTASAGDSAARLAGGPLLAAVAAGTAGVISLGLLYLTMARRGTTVVAPIAAGAAAVPVAVALLRGEGLGPRSGIGIGCALLGTYLAASAGESPSESPTDSPSGWTGPRTGPAPGRALLTLAAGLGSALGGGAFFVLIRVATVGGDPLAATLAARVASCALVAAWALGRRPQLRAVRAMGGWGLISLLLVGAGDAAAEVCFAGASGRAPQGVVAALSSLYPAVAVVLAMLLLRERVGRRGGAGLVCAVLGVALLADA
jgi:drug/metabolite transporter (DMT)-like permease